LDLEYLPEEELNLQTSSETTLEEEENLVKELLEIQEEEDHHADPLKETLTETPTLEEGEIPEVLEEGDTPMIGSQTN
jgi:hypothetical protein